MATTRNSSQSSYSVGATPPQVKWTFVKGDSSSFKVYVTNDTQEPLFIPDWTIAMKIKRPNSKPGIITDDATTIMALHPYKDADDLAGEFTVFLAATESVNLQTGDIFDIQLSALDGTVWTVCQGNLVVIEDVTD